MSQYRIYAQVCFKTGHNIQSLPLTPLYDPMQETLNPIFELRCTKCGMTLKQIEARKAPHEKKEEKANAATS